MRQEGHGALGHDDLPARGAHRGLEADHRGERLVRIAGGENDLPGPDLALRTREPELTPVLDGGDGMFRAVIDAELAMPVCSARKVRSEFTCPS